MRVDLPHSGSSPPLNPIKLNYLINGLNLRACDVIFDKHICTRRRILAKKNAREAHPSEEKKTPNI